MNLKWKDNHLKKLGDRIMKFKELILIRFGEWLGMEIFKNGITVSKANEIVSYAKFKMLIEIFHSYATKTNKP